MQENINIPDSTITTNLSFRQLVLMNMQQLTNFPYIEKDFDALTDYELLCLVVKFLNDVIANQNEQNASITRMYESFLALQTYVNNTKDTLEDAFNNLDNYVRNYFDNLDVQEEINNKLDQMLEDGVLTEIIQQFLQSNAIWCFDNVSEMKEATNLVNGSFAKTLGYYEINDGGEATYKIRTKTNDDVDDEASIIALANNTLVAELIIDDNINVKQFGAYGDNIHDDTTSFTNAIDFIKNHNLGELIIPSGTYYITDSILIENINNLNINCFGQIHRKSETEIKSCFTLKYCANITINNINIYSDKDQTGYSPSGFSRHTNISSNIRGLQLYYCTNCTFNNSTFKDLESDFVNQKLDAILDDSIRSNNIQINGWYSKGACAPIYTTHLNNLLINNANIEVATGMSAGDHFLYISEYCDTCNVNNSTFKALDEYFGIGIQFEQNIHRGVDAAAPINCYINNVNCTSNGFIVINQITNCICKNSIFEDLNNNSSNLVLRAYGTSKLEIYTTTFNNLKNELLSPFSSSQIIIKNCYINTTKRLMSLGHASNSVSTKILIDNNYIETVNTLFYSGEDVNNSGLLTISNNYIYAKEHQECAISNRCETFNTIFINNLLQGLISATYDYISYNPHVTVINTKLINNIIYNVTVLLYAGTAQYNFQANNYVDDVLVQ